MRIRSLLASIALVALACGGTTDGTTTDGTTTGVAAEDGGDSGAPAADTGSWPPTGQAALVGGGGLEWSTLEDAAVILWFWAPW